MTVLVGGVGQPGAGDLAFGRAALERLHDEPLGEDVVVEDLTPGVADVPRLLEGLRPGTLVVVGAAARGRPPATVQRRLASVQGSDEEDVRSSPAAVDRLVATVTASSVSPPRIVVVEIEPASSEPSEKLTPEVAAALKPVIDLIAAEVRRAPLLDLAGELRELMTSGFLEPTPVVDAVESLLAELSKLEREGRWGRTFAERDRLRLRISSGEHAGDGVSGLHWAMWWTLMEELDRLQALEATSGPR